LSAAVQAVILLDMPTLALHGIGGRPFLDYLIENCVRHGFRKLLLLARSGEEDLAGFLRARERSPGVTIDLLSIPTGRGEAATLRQAADTLERLFLLIVGDVFFDINVLDPVLGMVGSGPPLVVAAMRRNRPTGEAAGDIYLMDKAILAHLPEDGPIDSLLRAASRIVARRGYDGFLSIFVRHASARLPKPSFRSCACVPPCSLIATVRSMWRQATSTEPSS
jgi:hypothetical protein